MSNIRKERNLRWAAYVTEKREARDMAKSELGYRAEIDPSYITLIERDGYLPRRDKVIKLAEVLLVDTDECLLMAGYAPVSLPAKRVFELVLEERRRAG